MNLSHSSRICSSVCSCCKSQEFYRGHGNETRKHCHRARPNGASPARNGEASVRHQPAARGPGTGVARYHAASETRPCALRYVNDHVLLGHATQGSYMTRPSVPLLATSWNEVVQRESFGLRSRLRSLLCPPSLGLLRCARLGRPPPPCPLVALEWGSPSVCRASRSLPALAF